MRRRSTKFGQEQAAKTREKVKETLEQSSVSFFSKIPTIEHIKPQTENQRLFIKSLKQNTIVLALGTPGTGKSLLSIYTAIQLYNSPDSMIDSIYYVRCNVGNKDEQELGSTPGGLTAIEGKLEHLVYPLTSNLTVFMKPGDAKALLEFEKIKVMTVSHAKGITFRNAFVIVDEAEDLTESGLKCILTRIGVNSKIVLIGDPKQTDQKNNLKLDCNPLTNAANKLKDIPGVSVHYMGKRDIVRHPIIQDILDALD